MANSKEPIIIGQEHIDTVITTLTGAVDLLSYYKLLPHYEFFCKKSLPLSISDTHYLHDVIGDTEIRKGEWMQLNQSEKGVPTIPGKCKSKSRDKENKHKKHKDKDKEHKKHKHRHKDRSKDKDKEKKKDKSSHHDSGIENSKKHHEKKKKNDGNEDVNDIHWQKKSKEAGEKLDVQSMVQSASVSLEAVLLYPPKFD
ncbi:hypothetical protein L2E82_31252 [Cichorium intybus]|uniref:Uncharacterized protein n=1 Tax=Cichorium intybus TaxID=13427 RepID=A0ACB9D306_CICIN|nr:hypothetical protein L2E82_31252 [Cichorium intybus]